MRPLLALGTVVLFDALQFILCWTTTTTKTNRNHGWTSTTHRLQAVRNRRDVKLGDTRGSNERDRFNDVAPGSTDSETFPDHFKKNHRRPQGQQSSTSPRRFFADPSQSDHTAHSFNRDLQKLVRSGHLVGGKSAAQQAEDLLLARMQDSASVASYDTVSFNIVLLAWAKQHTLTGAHRADQLLSLLLRTNNATTITTNLLPSGTSTFTTPIRADAYSYSAVLHAYAKSGGKVKAALRATELLEQLERSQCSLSTDVCHNAAMNAWAVSGSPQAGERAERILRQLLGPTSTIAPTRIAFNACIKAYAKAGQPQDAQRLLDQMKRLSGAQPQLTPDKITYSSCIDAWSRSCDREDAAQQAERLLQELEASFVATGDAKIRPDVVSYTSVLAAYAKSKSGVDSHQAQELLGRMHQYAHEPPNAPFLNAWIHLLARASATAAKSADGHEAAAEEILEYMRREYARGIQSMKPCKISFTAVISVLAQVGTVASAQRAEALLLELESLWERTQDTDYLPNAKTFATVLNAWVKSGAKDATESAERLVHRMEDLYERTKAEELEPNLVVFLQVFQVLANSRDPQSAVKAKQLLQKMHQLQLSGFPAVRPDAMTYAYVINTFTKAKVENVAELATMVLTEAEEGYRAGIGSLKPTAMLYSSVLQAYAKCSSSEGAQLAEHLLARTNNLYRQGQLYAKPTTLHYNAVIDAHARSGQGRVAAERAEELLFELEGKRGAGDVTLKPNTRTFNAAILAWKNSGDSAAPRRAEALLRRMNRAYRAGDADCRPDRVTLNSIIGVWASSPDELGAVRAEQFLRFMHTSYVKGDATLQPDARTYGSCIAAYARRNAHHDAHRLYEELLQQCEAGGGGGGDRTLRPDRATLALLFQSRGRGNHRGNGHRQSRTPAKRMSPYDSRMDVEEDLVEDGSARVVAATSGNSSGWHPTQ